MFLWALGSSGVWAAEPARVVVLQWGGTDTTSEHPALRRQIEGRLGGTVAFAPDVDLYQPGRSEPDHTLEPGEQRASPSAEAIDEVTAQVEEAAALPFDSLSEKDWLAKADELRLLAEELWFIDRAELREPVFLLYSQIGRAAENANSSAPPFYAQIDGKAVNYYWYLAGALAQREPSLLSKLSDELRANVGHYKDQLDHDEYKPLTLSFDLNHEFDGRAFAEEYVLYVNGLQEEIVDSHGLYDVPLGITDVYLQHEDGSHGLSVRLERQTVDKGFEFPRQDAQKRMGLDLIQQLMQEPAACVPELDGDIVDYLAVYAALHPKEEVHVAVPQFGATSNKRLWLWRWDRTDGRLELLSRKEPCD